MRPEDVFLLKVFGISFVAIIILAVTLLHVLSWYESVSRCPRIKFKAFKRFYALNSDRWECKSDNVVCVISTHSAFGMEIPNERESFHFGFIDYYRYKLWLRKRNKMKEDSRNMQITAKMVAAVKKDIVSNEQKANQYLTDAANNIKQILQEE